MLTLLYVPGDRPERIAKALASSAGGVAIDLEDAVAPDAKDAARDALVRFLSAAPAHVQVRINDSRSAYGQADLKALGGLGVALRLPKIESAEQVRQVAVLAPGAPLHVLLESALGIEQAYDIATAHPAVASIGLGEADLKADLSVTDDTGLAWARSRVIVAARAAGLPSPLQSVYPDVHDLDGLALSCRTGRALGFRGRTAIHPAQLPIITNAYRPTPEEIATARRILAAAQATPGATTLPDGTFIDPAITRQAERILADAD